MLPAEPFNGFPEEFSDNYPTQGDDLVDAAQAITDGIARIEAAQQQTNQLLVMLIQQLQSAGRRKIVRDEQGRVVGSEPG